MSEQTMRARVVRALRPLDAISVENRVGPGTPDVNYAEGWLELKWIRRWPRNCDEDPVLVDHFTPQQRSWLLRRHRRGGNIHLLLQVGQEHLLFRAPEAVALLGRATRPELMRGALVHWTSGLPSRELIEWLTRDLASSRA